MGAGEEEEEERGGENRWMERRRGEEASAKFKEDVRARGAAAAGRGEEWRRGEAVVEAVASSAGEMAKRRRCSREAPASGVRPAAALGVWLGGLASTAQGPGYVATTIRHGFHTIFFERLEDVFLRDEEEKNIIVTPGKVIYLFIVKKN